MGLHFDMDFWYVYENNREISITSSEIIAREFIDCFAGNKHVLREHCNETGTYHISKVGSNGNLYEAVKHAGYGKKSKRVLEL